MFKLVKVIEFFLKLNFLRTIRLKNSFFFNTKRITSLKTFHFSF